MLSAQAPKKRDGWMMDQGDSFGSLFKSQKQKQKQPLYPQARELNPNLTGAPTVPIFPHEQLSELTEGASIDDMVKHEKLAALAARENKTFSLDRNIHLVSRIEKIKEECLFCRRNNLKVISSALTCYLVTPRHDRLHALHFQIIPREHLSSTRSQLDDEQFREELRNYKKCIIKFHTRRGYGTVFLECCPEATSIGVHTLVDAVPVPTRCPDMQAYWWKCLQEAEPEFSTQNAAVMRTDKAKTLQGSIPASFSYLYIEYAMDLGLVHLVEGGHLDPRWLRKQQRLACGDYMLCEAPHKKDIDEYFTNFDWTKMLNE